jgi:hypothetical protein
MELRGLGESFLKTFDAPGIQILISCIASALTLRVTKMKAKKFLQNILAASSNFKIGGSFCKKRQNSSGRK